MEHQAAPHWKSGTPEATEAFERFFHYQVNGGGRIM